MTGIHLNTETEVFSTLFKQGEKNNCYSVEKKLQLCGEMLKNANKIAVSHPFDT